MKGVPNQRFYETTPFIVLENLQTHQILCCKQVEQRCTRNNGKNSCSLSHSHLSQCSDSCMTINQKKEKGGQPFFENYKRAEPSRAPTSIAEFRGEK